MKRKIEGELICTILLSLLYRKVSEGTVKDNFIILHLQKPYLHSSRILHCQILHILEPTVFKSHQICYASLYFFLHLFFSLLFIYLHFYLHLFSSLLFICLPLQFFIYLFCHYLFVIHFLFFLRLSNHYSFNSYFSFNH